MQAWSKQKKKKEKKKRKNVRCSLQQRPIHIGRGPTPSSSPGGPPHSYSFQLFSLGETKPPVHQSPLQAGPIHCMVWHDLEIKADLFCHLSGIEPGLTTVGALGSRATVLPTEHPTRERTAIWATYTPHYALRRNKGVKKRLPLALEPEPLNCKSPTLSNQPIAPREAAVHWAI